MRKIAIGALCLLLSASMLTACRSKAPEETNSPTQAPTTATQAPTMRPTQPATQDPSNDNGILDDFTGEADGMNRARFFGAN